MNGMSVDNNKDDKIRKILIGIIIVLIIAIIIFIFLIFKSNSTSFNKGVKSEYSPIYDEIKTDGYFFLEEPKSDKDLYALFNKDDGKVTDYIYYYGYLSKFYNNEAIVQDTSENYKIIDTKGNIIKEFDDTDISDSLGNTGFFYKYDNKIYNLYNDSYNIDEDSDIIFNKEYVIIKDKTNKKYIILNYRLKTIDEIDFIDDIESDDIWSSNISIDSNDYNNYLYIKYGSTIHIYNIKSCKQIISFDSDDGYTQDSYVIDDDIPSNITLYSNNDYKNKKYFFIKDDKYYQGDENCDSYSYYGNVFICKTVNESGYSDESYAVNDDFTNVFQTSYNMFIDNKNYLINNTNSDYTEFSVDFYVNGEKTKSLPCSTVSYDGSGAWTNGIYALINKDDDNSSCDSSLNGTYTFYDKSGNKLFDKNYAFASTFDSNKHAIVSEDNINYYIIDEKGNKVSDTYKYINNISSDYYVVGNDDDKYGYISADLKNIIPCNYSSTYIFFNSDTGYAILTEDDKKVIYNLKDNKEVMTLSEDKTASISDNNYYTVSDGSKASYYTYYNDKLIYEK